MTLIVTRLSCASHWYTGRLVNAEIIKYDTDSDAAVVCKSGYTGRLVNAKIIKYDTDSDATVVCKSLVYR